MELLTEGQLPLKLALHQAGALQNSRPPVDAVMGR